MKWLLSWQLLVLILFTLKLEARNITKATLMTYNLGEKYT